MRRLPVVVALVGGFALTGCGGADAATTAASDAPTVSAAAADDLAITDDPFTTEVVNVADGAAITLSDAVDGDRPVLVWFWAPH